MNQNCLIEGTKYRITNYNCLSYSTNHQLISVYGAATQILINWQLLRKLYKKIGKNTINSNFFFSNKKNEKGWYQKVDISTRAR